MKAKLLIIGLFWWSMRTEGQEVFQFTADLRPANVVPPSPSGARPGTGTFFLTNTFLSYEILTEFLTGFTGGFYGPAGVGTNGPFIAPVARGMCDFGPGGNPDYCLYRGVTTIQTEQIPDLLAGLWYVQLTSQFFPQAALRGQVVLVPEPALAVIASAVAIVIFGFRLYASRRLYRGREDEMSLAAARSSAWTPFICGAFVFLSFLNGILTAASNQPPIFLPPRALLTNPAPLFLRDLATPPPSPAGVPTLDISPAPANGFFALGWDEIGSELQSVVHVPDTYGAVGTNYVMTMLNSEVGIHTFNGTNILRMPLITWWTTNSPLGLKQAR